MRALITIPVYNEEILLADTISKLHTFLQADRSFEYDVVIADNASTDRTLGIAHSLARQYPRTAVVHLDLKGRGRALKLTWLNSTADVLCYMDADLSTDLEALPPLVHGLASGKFAVGTGSRFLPPRRTTRSFRREVVSRGYNLMVKAMLGTQFSDAQCGFKAVTQRAARVLLPLIEDTGWFFDTELLALAERFGYPILDLPVRWIEGQRRASHVNIFRTAIDDIHGLRRLRRKLACLEVPKSPAVSESIPKCP